MKVKLTHNCLHNYLESFLIQELLLLIPPKDWNILFLYLSQYANSNSKQTTISILIPNASIVQLSENPNS